VDSFPNGGAAFGLLSINYRQRQVIFILVSSFSLLSPETFLTGFLAVSWGVWWGSCSVAILALGEKFNMTAYLLFAVRLAVLLLLLGFGTG
jgi:hypothetical protein